jgi:hypothetical protein
MTVYEKMIKKIEKYTEKGIKARTAFFTNYWYKKADKLEKEVRKLTVYQASQKI